VSKLYSPVRPTPTNAYWRIRNPVKKVKDAHNPNHNLGAECSVTWREFELARAVDLLIDQVYRLETRIENLEKPNEYKV